MAEARVRSATIWIRVLAACTVTAGFASLGLPAGQSDPVTLSVTDQVNRWVTDLANRSFAVRQTATRRLMTTGSQAVRGVAASVDSDDPEVALRSKIILTRIAQTDVSSVGFFLEAEHTGSPRLVRIVGKILQLPALQRESRLFRRRLTEQSEAELVLARRDVILGRSDSAWRRVRQLQSLDKRYGLFGQPNPVLAVIACLEVESADANFKANGIRNRAEKVQALLQQARIDLADGAIEESRRFATVANRLGSSPAQTAAPRLLLVEIESITLLQKARKDFAAGRLAAAREKVRQARETDRRYGLFTQAVHPETRAMFILFRASDPDGDLRVLNQKPTKVAARLLKSARADLDSKRFREARHKAASAHALGVDDRAKFFVKDIDDILNNSVQRRDVAERLLQIALEFTNEGDRAQATNWLAHVVRVYPTTEAAVKASQLLKSMP